MFQLFSYRPNYDEDFPHLDKAPIVEAVIDLQVVSVSSWDDNTLPQQIKSRLPQYPKIEQGREVVISFNKSQSSRKDLGCVGLRIISADGCYIAQFNKGGFALSRVKKYEDWKTFCIEAGKLWKLYFELLHPSAIKRIGVRFINRMVANYESRDFLNFFREAPKKSQIAGWQLENFLHRDVLKIPDSGYQVNLIKTIVSEPTKEKKVAAVLDCDVIYSGEVPCDWPQIEKHLKIMRWAKNKVFFGSVPQNKWREYK